MFKIHSTSYFAYLLVLLRECFTNCFFVNFIALMVVSYIVGYSDKVEPEIFAFLGALIGSSICFFYFALTLLPMCSISKTVFRQPLLFVVPFSCLPGLLLYWYQPGYLSLIWGATIVLAGALFCKSIAKVGNKEKKTMQTADVAPVIFCTSIIAVLAVSVYWQFFIDATLDPEVKNWIALSNENVTLENNGNVYRYGLGVEEGKDPYKEGLALVRINETKKGLNEEIPHFNKSNFSVKSLNLSEEMNCNLRDFVCLEYLLSQAEVLKSVLSHNQLLLGRYKELTHYQSFYPIYSTHSGYPEIGIEATLAARKIYLFNAIHLAANGRFGQAISDVIGDISLVRRIMKNELTLLSHAINVVHLQEDLYLLSFLLGNAPESFTTLNIDLILPIDATETGKLNRLLEREFSKSAVAILEDVNPAYEPGNLIYRLIFKPNRTINILFQKYMEIKGSYLLYEKEGRKNLGYLNKSELNIGIDYSNFIGSKLYLAHLPRFIDFASEYYDLNAQIQLLNFQLENYHLIRNDEDYYLNAYKKVGPSINLGLTAYKDRNLICFDTKESKKKFGLCIYLRKI